MINVLHVASFIGNIGDNASHIGLYRLLDQLLPPHQFTQLEIRKFYQNYAHEDKQHFDQAFIEHLNTYDLVIIGGGGFLDYWHENSQSATTIDISADLVAQIRVPTLICSMGSMPFKPVSASNIQKFQSFLSALKLNSYIEVALRNDGSVHSIERDVGAEYLEGLTEILDHGYFYQPEGEFTWPDKNFIALNITEDQLDMQRGSAEIIDKNNYYAEMQRVVQFIVHSLQYKVVLVPHIYSDLNAINRLLSGLDDWIVRQFISVAPCVQGNKGTHCIFNLYRQSRLIIGMRFHANVCAIAMNKNVIGLQALDRIGYLHDYFGHPQRCVSVTGQFSSILTDRISHALLSQGTSGAAARLAEAKMSTMAFYRDFFHKHDLIK